MLYALFLYQHDTGNLLYDKSFQEISEQKLELFSGFFQALKSFISEIVQQELTNIDLGEYAVMITSITAVKADLVIIADKEDNKLIHKITPKMLKIVLNHKELFFNWDDKGDNFNVLDNEISDLVQSQIKLTGEKTLIEKPISILKSIWARKKDLTMEQKNDLIQERNNIISEKEAIRNMLEKLEVYKKLLEIS